MMLSTKALGLLGITSDFRRFFVFSSPGENFGQMRVASKRKPFRNTRKGTPAQRPAAHGSPCIDGLRRDRICWRARGEPATPSPPRANRLAGSTPRHPRSTKTRLACGTRGLSPRVARGSAPQGRVGVLPRMPGEFRVGKRYPRLFVGMRAGEASAWAWHFS